MQKARLITINGPLGVGKSWTANEIAQKLEFVNVVSIRMSWQDPLAKACYALLGLTWGALPYDVFKVTDYYGRTGRQWMIAMSEDFAKSHDPVFFSRVMHDTIMRHHLPRVGMGYRTIYVADSNGFENELDYFKTREDIDILACSIEPPEYKERRGLPWIDGDSRYNLAHKCTLVAEDSTTMAAKILAAIDRRGWK